jgi:nitroreductase
MKKVNYQLFKTLSAFACIVFFTASVSAQMKNPGSTAMDSKTTTMKDSGNGQESNIWDVFYSRRSVRKFKPDQVPEADIRKIIDAARMAPTSGNQQPWKFLVIRDRNVISRMMEECVKGSLARFDANINNTETRQQFEERIRKTLSTGYFSAPVFIVILTDNNSKYSDYNHWDGPLAAGYLMLAARASGYGTVFITDAIPENVTKTVLQIPDNYTRVCITPLGVPYEWPATPPKRDLSEMIAFDKL